MQGRARRKESGSISRSVSLTGSAHSTIMAVPYFGFVCIGFLAICVVLAVAVWIFVQSGDKGSNKLNGAAGCAVGGALVAIAGLMAVGCAVVLVVDASKRAVHAVREDVSRWDFSTPSAPPAIEHGDLHEHSDADEHADEHGDKADAADGRTPAHVVFTPRGGNLVAEREWLREHVLSDMQTTYSLESSSDGNKQTVDIELRLTDDEYRELAAAMSEHWPGSKLPDGGTVELRRE